MRTVRSFQSVGPFIVILGSVISDTIKFTFLFFEFYIPYTVAFWILFGGNENAGECLLNHLKSLATYMVDLILM